MAHKKKKRERKEALKRGKIGEYAFFGGQKDQPGQENRSKSGFGYKTSRQCPFLLPVKLAGCMSAWGRHRRYKETIAAHGTQPSYFPLLKYCTTIYYFDLAACALGPPPLSQHLEATGGLFCLLRTQVSLGKLLVVLPASRAHARPYHPA